MRSMFLSTLPARGATDCRLQGDHHPHVSIHAPREGSDVFKPGFGLFSCKFLSTLPARGATCSTLQRTSASCTFLSTLPARGAT